VLQAAMLPGAGEIGTHFPVKTKQWTQAVQGHSTDFVLNLFADCIFIIVTQLGKMGTLMRISKDQATSSSEEGETTFSVETLLGKRDDPALVVCGRQIAEDIVLRSTKPLLLSIALKENSQATIREVVEAIKANRIW